MMPTSLLALQCSGPSFVRCKVAGEFEGLVKPPFAQTLRAEWDGYDAVGCIKRGLYPRRVAHEFGQCFGQAWVGLKFKTCDALRPRIAVAHSGQALV